MFGDEEVRANDARQLVLESRGALDLDEFSRLALVQPAGNPLRLFAFRAFAVEQIDRAIELQQHAPKGFHLFCQGGTQRIRGWRGPPIETRE